MLCTKSQAFERRRRGNRVARGERSVAPGLLQKSARALKERQKRMFVSHFQRSMETAAIQGLRARFAHTAPGYLIPRRWRSNLFRAGGAPNLSFLCKADHRCTWKFFRFGLSAAAACR